MYIFRSSALSSFIIKSILAAASITAWPCEISCGCTGILEGMESGVAEKMVDQHLVLLHCEGMELSLRSLASLWHP